MLRSENGITPSFGHSIAFVCFVASNKENDRLAKL